MPELIGSTLGYIVGAVLMFELMFAPILIAWFLLHVARSLRRTAIASEAVAAICDLERARALDGPSTNVPRNPDRIANSAFGR
jgi:hypothetical protein